MFDKDNSTRLDTLAALNAALGRLNPPILPLTLVGMMAPGSTTAMLDSVIAADNTTLYDFMIAADLPDLATPLRALVDTHPITLVYDTHGDKHFPNSLKGTKFVMGAANQATVNTYLAGKVNALRGRIRRDANGVLRTYYLTEASGQYTGGKSLTVQVDYVPAPNEKLVYHGYPDAGVTRFGLSRTKGGPPIP